ncbi:1-epi-valienol-7-phosphate 1-kinase [Actinoplanes sp. SE50]|uniref:1-epi-valienol-7-phosphate 1-kinase n=1 Tax=unclassified Actinoplanes TaxID=2626549 RepID=UPI00006CA2D1|nr:MULTISPECIES: 1-epi-valienol-7-phosphate 1-kinase [unclassified Actinoplanes]AEV84563.1 1-epi-valienol-7-phosphate 1-kinase [Actinoplanes sp. SE50/110]ATO82955.1 1-epi-valienol-7-phosphate 1-kinase [Actinoplanes sp. SE50]CAJ81023.1 putative kinase (1-epi-valienol-7-phosphate 1-kinase) AcbU [Actinoplanes sp. SE50/110]SLM00363.1 1-epi-valienol-7-phosphate 1-kinase [Actinoplanes sp. SE50/110]
MTPRPVSTIDVSLASLLRTADWPHEDLRGPGGVRILDEAILGPSRLLIVAAERNPESRYFVAVLRHDPSREAVGDAAHDRAVVQAMRERLALPTAAGHLIVFDGDPAPFRATRPFDPGWSTNALSLADLDGTLHIHKAYRLVSAATREPHLLRLMHRGGRTQRWAGDYHYVEQPSGRRYPLGLLYAYAEGDSLDLPLRHSIRSMWPALLGGTEPAGAVTAAQRSIAGELPGVGRFLRDFHTELAQRLEPAPTFPVNAYLRETAERVAALGCRISADERYPRPVREAVVAALTGELDQATTSAVRVPWPAGPSHGDLHLSHILRRQTPDGWRLCVIDLSTPAPDPADPLGAAQSPWQDLVALLRGLEIFTADEFVHQAALRLGADQDDTCRTVLLISAGQTPDTPGWTGSRLTALRRMHDAASVWAGQVRRMLLSGYADGGEAAEEHPAWRIFRLRRLLHELDYAYAHDQHYHAAINLRHVLQTYRPPVTGES